MQPDPAFPPGDTSASLLTCTPSTSGLSPATLHHPGGGGLQEGHLQAGSGGEGSMPPPQGATLPWKGKHSP